MCSAGAGHVWVQRLHTLIDNLEKTHAKSCLMSIVVRQIHLKFLVFACIDLFVLDFNLSCTNCK